MPAARRRRWAHAPAIHVYHEKRGAWVSICMHACDPVPIVNWLKNDQNQLIKNSKALQKKTSCKLMKTLQPTTVALQ